MEDTENVNDLYMEFKNGETKLNDVILNQLQRLIKQDIQEHAEGNSTEIIQQDGEATETNVYSADAINKMNIRNIAIAYNETTQNINSEYTIYPLANADLIGNKLKLENGKIIIGKGVKKVKVNASAFLEDVGSTKISYVWLQILQNGQRKCGSISSGVAVWFQSIVVSDYILDVKENDYIELEINNANYTTHVIQARGGKENTRLYVEVIE